MQVSTIVIGIHPKKFIISYNLEVVNKSNNRGSYSIIILVLSLLKHAFSTKIFNVKELK